TPISSISSFYSRHSLDKNSESDRSMFEHSAVSRWLGSGFVSPGTPPWVNPQLTAGNPHRWCGGVGRQVSRGKWNPQSCTRAVEHRPLTIAKRLVPLSFGSLERARFGAFSLVQHRRERIFANSSSSGVVHRGEAGVM
ncbi:hypothetical protein HN011_011844, partial [Eciton burchellii]